MKFDRNLIECAIIKADITKKNSTYEMDGNTSYFSYSYNVRVKNIEDAIKFIKATYEEFGIPCSRVYISGFAILSENYIWTKGKMVEVIGKQAKIIKSMQNNNASMKR